jgi:hypothetical protein
LGGAGKKLGVDDGSWWWLDVLAKMSLVVPIRKEWQLFGGEQQFQIQNQFRSFQPMGNH